MKNRLAYVSQLLQLGPRDELDNTFPFFVGHTGELNGLTTIHKATDGIGANRELKMLEFALPKQQNYSTTMGDLK